MATIVHLIDSLRVGGAQTHLLTMIRHAAGNGYMQHYVISLFDDGPVGDELRALEVSVDILGIAPLLAQHRYRAAVQEVESVVRAIGPDIAEAHLSYSRIIGLYAAWRAGVPQRFAFEHGDLYLTAPKFRLAQFLAQRFAQRVIVVSEALAAWARATYRLSPRRTMVLYNCVDLDRFRASAVTPATDLGLPDGATKLVAVGTLGTGVNKRVDVLIRAIAKAREDGADVALAICGDGELRSDLEQLAASLGVQDHVRFLGMRGDVPAVLAACHAWVLGTAFDPFPIAGLEALAMGLPIVVPDAGGMVEAVEPSVTGLVYPVLDHHSLAEKMAWLRQHPVEREQMGQAARQSAEDRFSLNAYMDRLYALYGVSGDGLQGGWT